VQCSDYAAATTGRLLCTMSSLSSTRSGKTEATLSAGGALVGWPVDLREGRLACPRSASAVILPAAGMAGTGASAPRLGEMVPHGPEDAHLHSFSSFFFFFFFCASV